MLSQDQVAVADFARKDLMAPATGQIPRSRGRSDRRDGLATQTSSSGKGPSDPWTLISDMPQMIFRGLLVPGAGRGPSPGSSAGDISVTPPPPASTDASPADPSPLAPYTSASFTQSDMELVASPTAKSTDVPSTDAASLQWDDYDHQAELSFNLQ